MGNTDRGGEGKRRKHRNGKRGKKGERRSRCDGEEEGRRGEGGFTELTKRMCEDLTCKCLPKMHYRNGDSDQTGSLVVLILVWSYANQGRKKSENCFYIIRVFSSFFVSAFAFKYKGPKKMLLNCKCFVPVLSF